MKRKMYIGSYVISWNKTTWIDWLPLTVVFGGLALFMIGMFIYYNIIGGIT